MAKFIHVFLEFIERIPLLPLGVLAVFMSLAPFSPEPHLVEKLRMLVNGELTKGLDIFDLFWHGFFPVLFLLRLSRYKKTVDDQQGK